MSSLLIILHVLVCLALIAIVLLQGGKGAQVGASFGAGSSQTVFGATGGQSFMGKLTAGAAIIFMLTSLTLAYFYGQPGSGSVMPASVAPQQSATTPDLPVSAPPAAPSEEQSASEPAAAPAEQQPAGADEGAEKK